ncbi:MAG: serine/threonine protein kinase [Leptolyngbya sp. SIO1E4]|nr:serine/threonine protein kinase [Leptolyngbya sp. SIO1E4]
MGSPNHLLGGRYRILRELGRGGFGYTYLAEDINRFNELCVLKEFFPQVDDNTALQKAKQLFEREAGVLYQLNHPQIPKFRELLRVQTGNRGRLFLIQDYVEGPTYQELLETRLKSGNRFSEPEVTQLLQRVLPVLEYLHSIGVIHRDIAPDNLILRNADGLPVLIDFGGVKKLATVVQQQVGASAVPTRLGKVGYAPEEQLETGQVTPSADFYALAVTALVLLTGESPQVLYDSYSKRWYWQEYVTLSPRLTKVLERMLAPRSRDRYGSAAAVMNALLTPDTYAVPTAAPSGGGFEPTIAVAPGAGTIPPSTIARPPTPTPQKPKHRANNRSGCLQAFLGLVLLLGTVGLVWWIASRWDPTGSVNPESVGSDNSEAVTPSPNPTFSREEQARKNSLRQRRESLQVDNRFLVRVTDQLFYGQFPERQGRPLTDRPEDEAVRSEWDSIANEVLDVLETHLSTQARQRLGSYAAENRDQWRQQVNQRFVSSRALYDLTDAKFAYLYPQNAAQDFIEQPIGQIWHGIADDRARAILAQERVEEIQFEQGRFSQSLRDRLEPGEGRVYVINLNAGQLMRLNLQAPPQGARLSVYVPDPSEEVPYLLEDSTERTWSGQLPQSGYYEIVVVSTQTAALDYALDIGADNVSSSPTASPSPSPTAPPTEPEELPRDRN